MADYGVKVSREGYSITSEEPRDYVFWSNHATVKIFKQGSGTLTIPNGSYSATVNIPHGLSFIPMYLVFFELLDGSGKWFSNRTMLADGDADAGSQYVPGGYSTNPYTELGLLVDSTNLVIKCASYNDSGHSIKYYYFIFGDKGGT